MALERRRGTPALQDMQLGTRLPKPTCARHRQWSSLATWGSLLWYYRTSFCGHTFLCLRCLCGWLSKRGAPPLAASHTLNLSSRSCPYGAGHSPALSLVISLSVRKPRIQVFLMILGFNFVFIEPDEIQLSDGSSIMLF